MLVSFFNLWFCDLPACKLEDWNVTINHRLHSLFMQTVWSGVHNFFVRFKSIIFCQNSPKIKLFLKKKMPNFQVLQTPVPPAAGSFAPQTPNSLRRLGAPPSHPQTQPLIANSAYIPGNFELFLIICVFVAFVLSNFFLIGQLQTLWCWL